MRGLSELKVERFLLASQSLREAVGGTAPDSVLDAMGLMPDPVDPDLQLQNPGQGQGSSDGGGSGESDWAASMARLMTCVR